MKLNRSQLKDLIKECLVEILSEGLGARQDLSESLKTKKQVVEQQNPRAKVTQNISYNRQKTNDVVKKVQSQISSLSNDPIMASIFADTAERTLPAMLENDGNQRPIMEGTDVASRLVASSDPIELFGEDETSKWTELAFSGPTNKNK